MMQENKIKTPYWDLFILLFLTVYCWWTLWYWIYKEWVGDLIYFIKVFTFEWLFIYAGLPILFWYGVYKYNKNYFKQIKEKYFHSEPEF